MAIHGEKGHWCRSWTSGSYFWLVDAIPQKFQEARIISCEHGGVRENIIENLLWDLIDDRAANGRSYVPLIIIAHSFGGTLAKQLFTASSPSRNSWLEANVLHSYIKGYMFFNTVQVGGPSEDMRRIAGFAASSFSRMTRFVGYHLDLSYLNSFLDQISLINLDFEGSGGLQVPTVCFYASQPTRVGFGFEVCLIDSNPLTVSLTSQRSPWSQERRQSCNRRRIEPSTPTIPG